MNRDDVTLAPFDYRMPRKTLRQVMASLITQLFTAHTSKESTELDIVRCPACGAGSETVLVCPGYAHGAAIPEPNTRERTRRRGHHCLACQLHRCKLDSRSSLLHMKRAQDRRSRNVNSQGKDTRATTQDTKGRTRKAQTSDTRTSARHRSHVPGSSTTFSLSFFFFLESAIFIICNN